MKGMSRTYLKDDVGNIYTFNVKACTVLSQSGLLWQNCYVQGN